MKLVGGKTHHEMSIVLHNLQYPLMVQLYKQDNMLKLINLHCDSVPSHANGLVHTMLFHPIVH